MRRSITGLLMLAICACGIASAKADVRSVFQQVTDGCRFDTSGFKRTGYSNSTNGWARCFPNQRYSGYYVGGGAAKHADVAGKFHGEPRYASEGTFGIDYDPWYSRVRLQWFHGSRFQGGPDSLPPRREKINWWRHLPKVHEH